MERGGCKDIEGELYLDIFAGALRSCSYASKVGHLPSQTATPTPTIPDNAPGQ